MPKGYVILTEDIRDSKAMEAYAEASRAAMVEYAGVPLVVEEKVEVVEGEWHGNRTVVIEFESVEKARQWYDSDAYRAARPVRQAAAECNMVILSGFVPRPTPPA